MNILVKKENGSTCYIGFCDALELSANEEIKILILASKCWVNIKQAVDNCNNYDEILGAYSCVTTTCDEFSLCNKVPIAIAGEDNMIVAHQTIKLTGSGTDEDGQIEGYKWTQTGGPALVFNSNDQSPEITPTIEGVYKFELVVTDDFPADSIPDEVVITVTPNLPPVVTFNLATDVDMSTDIQTAIGAADPEGYAPISYKWANDATNEAMVSFDDDTIKNPVITIPSVSEDTQIKIKLTACDAYNSCSENVHIINIKYLSCCDYFDDFLIGKNGSLAVVGSELVIQ